MKSLPIGEVLKEYGYINEEQLQIALDAQKKKIRGTFNRFRFC